MRTLAAALALAATCLPSDRTSAQDSPPPARAAPPPARVSGPSAEKKTAPPSLQFLRRAQQWLESSDPKRRRAAFRSFMQLGPEAMPYYKKALQNAAKFHNERLESIVGDRRANPYAAHDQAARQLDEERTRILPLIRTDYHKDPAKIRMLTEEMTALGRLYDKTMDLALVNTSRFDAQLDATAAALAEIARELERFEPDRDTASLGDEELKIFVVKDNIETQTIVEQRPRLLASRKETADLAAAERDNAAAGRWASPAMQSFATQLNRERAWIGLPPFRLEEKLSAAAEGHSTDMAKLGFFSHTSPVKGKESSGQRARAAGFTGRWTGENIYMGSTDPAAAYRAWFGSDGHRFIMFASGPNVIGVGIHGRHWTLMTGRI